MIEGLGSRLKCTMEFFFKIRTDKNGKGTLEKTHLVSFTQQRLGTAQNLEQFSRQDGR